MYALYKYLCKYLIHVRKRTLKIKKTVYYIHICNMSTMIKFSYHLFNSETYFTRKKRFTRVHIISFVSLIRKYCNVVYICYVFLLLVYAKNI